MVSLAVHLSLLQQPLWPQVEVSVLLYVSVFGYTIVVIDNSSNVELLYNSSLSRQPKQSYRYNQCQSTTAPPLKLLTLPSKAFSPLSYLANY